MTGITITDLAREIERLNRLHEQIELKAVGSKDYPPEASETWARLKAVEACVSHYSATTPTEALFQVAVAGAVAGAIDEEHWNEDSDKINALLSSALPVLVKALDSKLDGMAGDIYLWHLLRGSEGSANGASTPHSGDDADLLAAVKAARDWQQAIRDKTTGCLDDGDVPEPAMDRLTELERAVLAIPARTAAGLAAKAGIVRGILEPVDGGLDGEALISLFADIDRLAEGATIERPAGGTFQGDAAGLLALSQRLKAARTALGDAMKAQSEAETASFADRKNRALIEAKERARAEAAECGGKVVDLELEIAATPARTKAGAMVRRELADHWRGEDAHPGEFGHLLDFMQAVGGEAVRFGLDDGAPVPVGFADEADGD